MDTLEPCHSTKSTVLYRMHVSHIYLDSFFSLAQNVHDPAVLTTGLDGLQVYLQLAGGSDATAAPPAISDATAPSATAAATAAGGRAARGERSAKLQSQRRSTADDRDWQRCGAN